MAGMTEKRKVRKDFDPTKKYIVNVLGCTEEEKKEVQQAFFDIDFLWLGNAGNTYKKLNAAKYTNTNANGYIVTHLMYNTNTKGCNMTAKEFLDLVYEPEQRGHIHAELMAQYAEDAKTHKEPWKLWEFRGPNGKWMPVGPNIFWDPFLEYRRKPETHIVNGVEVPDLRITPELEQYYWYPDPSGEALVFRSIRRQWSASDNHRIANNLCYQYSEEGKQAATLHSKAWLGVV